MLDLSKIEAEQLDLKPVPSDLRKTAERSLAPVRASAAGKGVVLSTDVGAHVPETAVFDSVRLEQVLVNLLSNAVKFTERGSVELSVRFAPLSGSTGAFTFSVRDTGIGISPEARSRIFEPFYQADDSHTRKYGGTGLGLSISQRLLQKMGSSLEVESVQGEGSRFFFTLRFEYGGRTGEAPSDARAEPSPPESGAHISPGRRKEHPVVLIVEDEKISMKMLVLLVKKFASFASVVQAENGEEAVALFRERRPDLVFMDLQMPGKDGFEAAAEIRAFESENDPEEERCCIVALTADVLPETRGECLAAGMDDYLTKPARWEEIKAVLERCLGTDARGGRAPGSASD